MCVESATFLHATEVNMASNFQSFVIQDCLIDAFVIGVEFGNRLNHIVRHLAIESVGLATARVFSHFVHPSFYPWNILLNSREQSFISEPDLTVRMLNGLSPLGLK